MSDLSDVAAVQNLVGSRNGTINVAKILQNRDFARQFAFEAKDAGSGVVSSPEQATARSSVQQANENRYVFTPPAAKSPVIREFRQEQAFEGTVMAISPEEGMFTARLTNISGIGPDEEGEFSIDELNGDQGLVVPGALFTWTIGLQVRGQTRQQVRISDIRFRRLPSVSPQFIAEAEAEARELSEFLRETESAEPLSTRM